MLSIIDLVETLSINENQYKCCILGHAGCHHAECRYSECRGVEDIGRCVIVLISSSPKLIDDIVLHENIKNIYNLPCLHTILPRGLYY
jgi:hypothetical protein